MYQFRLAQESDFDAICRLVHSEEELFIIYPAGRYPFNVEQVREISEKRTDLTVITDDEKVIGFGNLYGYQPGEYAFVGNVIVDQQYRGHGLGKDLVIYLSDTAFEKYQLPELRISVFSDNVPALLLYAALGFKPYDLEDRLSPDGKRAALIHMQKPRPV